MFYPQLLLHNQHNVNTMRKANHVWVLLGKLSWPSRPPATLSGTFSALPTAFVERLISDAAYQWWRRTSAKQGEFANTLPWFLYRDSNQAWIRSLPTTIDTLSSWIPKIRTPFFSCHPCHTFPYMLVTVNYVCYLLGQVPSVQTYQVLGQHLHYVSWTVTITTNFCECFWIDLYNWQN